MHRKLVNCFVFKTYVQSGFITSSDKCGGSNFVGVLKTISVSYSLQLFLNEVGFCFRM